IAGPDPQARRPAWRRSPRPDVARYTSATAPVSGRSSRALRKVALAQLSRLDRIDFGQVLRDPGPLPPLVTAGPQLAAGRTEVQSHGIAAIGGHRLPLH